MKVQSLKGSAFSEKSQRISDAVLNIASDLAVLINHDIKDSREKSLALTKLEECTMWADRALKMNDLREGNET